MATLPQGLVFQGASVPLQLSVACPPPQLTLHHSHCALPKLFQNLAPISWPTQMEQVASGQQVANSEPRLPEDPGTSSQSSITKIRKGIRNKAIKKTDQGTQIVDAGQLQLQATQNEENTNDCPVLHQASPQRLRKGLQNKAIVKPDQLTEAFSAQMASHSVSADPFLLDNQIIWPQMKHNKIIEQIVQGNEIADSCPTQGRTVDAFNLEPAHRPSVKRSDSVIGDRSCSPVGGRSGSHIGSVTDAFPSIPFIKDTRTESNIGGGVARGKAEDFTNEVIDEAQRGDASMIFLVKDTIATSGAHKAREQAEDTADKPIIKAENKANERVSKVEVHPCCFNINDLLKWRCVVTDDEISQKLTCCALSRERNDRVPKSWREEAVIAQQKNTEKKKISKENQSKSSASKQAVLKETEHSWSAQQKLRAKDTNGNGRSDEQIIRDMKAILNKLTMAKYDILRQKIVSCGMSTVEHVVILIDEILEKAQTQHHFIHMYCQLCVDLHKWFKEQKIAESAADMQHLSFRHILLNQCQNKFEDNLSPLDLGAVKEDDAEEALVKHKLAMLGNIKFIAALLEAQMLNDVVLIHIAHELCHAAAPHTLESLACFLTSVGPTFAQPNYRHYEHLRVIFVQVEEKSKDKSIAPRIRFLLRDLLDLQKAGWKKVED
eukprot:gnl/MRDRNA2_/MRDRNA2_88577_c0_seq1.p1 gnl/MRDRNA2_/MRDRNA2_88577_c0~~gnl/MRDRNA2_/MRDRNA2_88577_c0_seq1.p1  ORF type:complete len:662 (+),score=134.39 gnl/MRDRNA2_/MRDRNA2_88577_c0_seq1:132-2117(+)